MMSNTENKAPAPNSSVRHRAAGNLAFLLSVIRCGEQLSPEEEANVRKVIQELEDHERATPELASRFCDDIQPNPGPIVTSSVPSTEAGEPK